MVYRIRVREDAPDCYFDWRGWWFLQPMEGLTDTMLDAAIFTDTDIEYNLYLKDGIDNGLFEAVPV
ncbi:hypothetical protein BAU67_001924 [Escherichia coli]|nr:hypothetical protein [Escherichia coli]EMB7054164.1 hypothetical protein [Escherichia coli]